MNIVFNWAYFGYLLYGAMWTLVLTACAFVLGGAAGFVGCWAAPRGLAGYDS